MATTVLIVSIGSMGGIGLVLALLLVLAVQLWPPGWGSFSASRSAVR